MTKISLSRAFFLVAISSIFTRGFTVLKDVLTANFFGRGPDIEVYLLSYVIPYTISTIVGAAIAAAFIPLFFRLKREKENFLTGSYVITLALSLILALIVFFSMKPILVGLDGETAEKIFKEFGVAPFQLLSWMIIPHLSSALLGAYLNCKGKYNIPILCFAISPAASVLALLIFPRSIVGLALGTLLGFFLEALTLLVVSLWFKFPLKWRHLPRWRTMKEFLQSSGVLLGGTSFSAGPELIDKAMAGLLSSGSVPALEYGSKMTLGLTNFLRSSFGNILMPRFSSYVAEKKTKQLQREVWKLAALCLLVGGAISAALIFFSNGLISLFFKRGAFKNEDVEVVARVQDMFALQIPFYLCSFVGTWVLVALERHKTILLIAATTFVLNVIGNFILMKTMGVVGIALSTSLAYLLSAIFSIITAEYLLRRIR